MSCILKNVQEFTRQRKQETGRVKRQMTRHGIVKKTGVVVGRGVYCTGELGQDRGAL